MIHRNTGAPFRRADGSTWHRDAEHEATAEELKRRAYKLRLVVTRIAPALQKKREDGWPLAMQPERYLAISPEGKHAPLARQIVGDAQSPLSEELAMEEEELDSGTDQ